MKRLLTVLFVIIPIYGSTKTHLLEQDPEIAFEEIKFPFLYIKFDVSNTAVISQGEEKFICFKSGKYKKVYTEPCCPCVAIIIHDTKEKTAWMGHLDVMTNLDSFEIIYKTYFKHSKKNDISIFLYSKEIPKDVVKTSDDYEEQVKELEHTLKYFKKYTLFESQEMYLNHLCEYVKKTFGLMDKQVTSKLFTSPKPLGFYGKYEPAMAGIGFDVCGGSYFTCSFSVHENDE